ncbi:MAG: hypothetical protein ABIG64_09910 [Candidatus Omnitrophota bacterium]
MFTKKQFFYNCLGFFVLVSLVFLVCLAQGAGQLTAESAIIIGADNQKIYYRKNIEKRLPVASTVKVLTAVIIREKLELEKKIPITKRASGIAPSKAYLAYGVVYKVKDLLKCFLMSSANDAGVALAEAIAPTEFDFSLLMNKKAQTWGAKNSFFLNATGLPEHKKRQYSTVYDLSIFMHKFLEYPELIQIMETKQASIIGSDAKIIEIRNHNKFLWKKSNDLIGKTGYTNKAKHCFLGVFSQGKKKLIIAILGSRKPWDDLAYLINKKYN